MPAKKIITPLLPGRTYHIFNRGNNHEQIFWDDISYNYFISLMKRYLAEYIDILAFSLVFNHFHQLIRVHDSPDVDFFRKRVSEAYRRFFIDYTQKCNHHYGHNGSLMLKNFRRIEVLNQEYLKHLLFYVHYNPLKHKLCEDYKTYKYSSYQAFINGKYDWINTAYVMDIFNNDLTQFIEFHDNMLVIQNDRNVKKSYLGFHPL
jgi:REP element-mobilizing transposase RayT